jgi:hypothetical protein
MFLENLRRKKTKCFRRLEEEENQMCLESCRSKKTKCFRRPHLVFFLLQPSKTFGFLAPPAF